MLDSELHTIVGYNNYVDTLRDVFRYLFDTLIPNNESIFKELISKLENEVARKELKINDLEQLKINLESKVGELENEISGKENEVNELKDRINSLEAVLDETQKQVMELKDLISSKELEIEDLKKQAGRAKQRS
ncbi:MAG: Chromosome segregation ATPase-like protein [Thermotoga sp. 50_1627]|nr:MAG: Chromosome segregation ATPase-like protein [Thermotoga sp. 50_64]KUK24946.1 MAG: Chromosome segregation ATPase-like protein [Thermotoga sp. 50_1627]MDK2922753.1 hypothetical protein [Pseudothermotoga sp.]